MKAGGESKEALKEFHKIRAKREQLLGFDQPQTLNCAHEQAELMSDLMKNE